MADKPRVMFHYDLTERDETGKVRIVGVEEGDYGYVPMGRVSNDPNEPPPLYVAKEDAAEWCRRHNARLGLGDQDQREILLSSMSGRWRCFYDQTEDRGVIMFGKKRIADPELPDAEELFVSMAAALDVDLDGIELPWGRPDDEGDEEED